MKKQIAAAATALMVAGFAVVPVAAAGETYTFEEDGFSCTVPDELSVFTRDMEQDDPLCDDYDLDYEYMEECMDENSACLLMLDEAASYQILLSSFEGTFYSGDYPYLNFAGLSENELEAVFDFTVESIAEADSVVMQDS